MINNKPSKSLQPGTARQSGSLRLLLFTAMVMAWLLPDILFGQTEPSALLELQSTEQGFLLPRMTQAQRDAIVSPAKGLQIYNTTTDCLDINFGTPATPHWQALRCVEGIIGSLNCGGTEITGTLTVGTASDGVSLLVPYTGGNGGNYPGQAIASTGVSGLTATLVPGNFIMGDDSVTYVLSGTPAATGTASFALNIGGQSCVLSVSVVTDCWAKVSFTDTLYFLCHNLGSANTSADPFTPSWEIIGGYWQWGRLGEAAPGPSSTSEPNAEAISGWITTAAPNGFWQDGTKTANDPCPSNFKIPTWAQWGAVVSANNQSIVGTWSTTYSNHTNYSAGRFFGPALMLPAAGHRLISDGTLFYRGYYGYYWSSSESGTEYAWYLEFSSENAQTYNTLRQQGYSVRCAAE
jgi:uncharacterized protein (TIGR02145 family)